MTKDVLIIMKGLQSFIEAEDPDEVELVSKGEYYFKNGHHYIFFEEVLEGFTQTTKTSIKITNKSVEVKKKGLTNVQMIFEENKKNITYYFTPFGNLEMGIAATNIDFQEEKDKIKLRIEYALEIGGEHVADCQILVDVQGKDTSEFTL